MIHPLHQIVLDLVKASPDEQARITTVANEFAAELQWITKYTTRKERDEARKRGFQIVGELVKSYRLQRIHRKWVRWLPPDNPLRQAWLEHIERTVASLPHPQLG